jgi:hypothetical protein
MPAPSPSVLSNPTVSSGLGATLAAGTPPGVVTSSINLSPTEALGVGFSIGCVQKCYTLAGPISVTNGSAFTVNVYTGTDIIGNALNMATLTHIEIENLSTTAGQKLTVGAGTHAVLGSDSYTVGANGGEILIQNPGDGFTVASGSTDTLQVAVSSGTTTFNIVLLGR